MQRILQPGEIESLDRIEFPRVRLPRPRELFTDRAARLRQLAAGAGEIAGYLRLLAQVVERQAIAAMTVRTAAPDPALLARALAHGLPPLPAADPPDPAWRTVLHELLAGLAPAAVGQAPLGAVLAELARLDDTALDTLARACLDGSAAHTVAQPFVMAALQVAATDRAARLDASALPGTAPATVCPACGSLPVASVLRIGGSAGGHRYLHCGLCATEWHMVRVKCSHCESTRGIHLRGIDGGDPTVAAETCDACHTYRKLVNQEKDPLAEPLADDLASLALDLLMAETDYERASGNPLLALSQE